MADWQEEKRRVLEEAHCIVFKVGSAVITDDQGLSLDVIDRLADQIAAVSRLPGGERRRIVLVTSGAVSAGRSVCRERGVEQESHGMSARQAFAAIGQGRLVRAWDDAFRKRGLSTALILLTRDDIRSRERLLNIRNTFAELLSWGVVPIVNENDTVSIRELKFGDNDTLASLLVNLVGAELYVSVTTAPGVYDRNPAEPGAAIMESIPNVFALNLGTLCGGKTTLGTGGMYSKLLAARRAAQLGVPTYILPGREPDIIARAFASGLKGAGTWVCPRQHAIPQRKFWLAYKTEPLGTIEVDDGAAEALLNRGKSLLPGGIVSVEGTFQKGAPVRVTHNGVSIGVGLSNYSSAEIERIRGLKRIEVAAILGDAHYPEVIHRDNLLLGAAV